MTRPRRTLTVAALLTVPALALAACGSSGSTSSSPSASPATSSAEPSASPTSAAPTGGTVDAPFATTDCATLPPPVGADAAPADGVTVDAVTVTGKEGKAPVVTIGPDAEPATDLIIEDVVVGDGTEAKAGDQITVNYCGVGLTTRAMFDSSWARGEPIQFPLSGLIKGWEDGIPGMKAGGRRLLIIPADQAYGETGTPDGSVLPGETLVFVVDLVSIP